MNDRLQVLSHNQAQCIHNLQENPSPPSWLDDTITQPFK